MEAMSSEQKLEILRNFKDVNNLNSHTFSGLGNDYDESTPPKKLLCGHMYYPLVKCKNLPAPEVGYKSFAYKN